MPPNASGIPPAKFTTGALDRLRFCFNSSLPLGSAQHQKIVVIDGAVAFSGGLDLTIRRWDTSEHAAGHPHRADPDGKPYPPFHDVQCMVDGEAAAALAELAESRWRAAGCTDRKRRRDPRRPLACLGAGPGQRHHGGHRADGAWTSGKSKATKPTFLDSSTGCRGTTGRNRCSRSIRRQSSAAWPASCNLVADPREPLELERAAGRMWTMRTILAAGGLAAALGGLALAWQYTSLSDFADVGFVSSVIAQRSEFAPLLAIAAFVVGGLVVFPVLVLIAATAAALGPWLGFVSAAAGVLLSSLVLFGIGRVLGHVRLQRLLGRRSSRIQSRIIGKGIVAVAMIRMVPIAPFSIVNVASGASKLRLRDYMVGTALGMAPGIAAMAALGAQIADLARNASWTNALLLGVAIVAWIAVCLGVQFLVTWLAGRRT